MQIGKELANRLEQVLVAIVIFLSNQGGEDGLKSIPVFGNVSMGSENAAQGNVHLVLACHV